MRPLYPLALATVLILIGLAWVNSTIGAKGLHATASVVAPFDAFRAMSTAKKLPSPQYDLY